MVYLKNYIMELTIKELFEESKKLDFEFIKSNEVYLKFFYLMMGKKTCNCPHKPRLLTDEMLHEAYSIYSNFNNSLPEDFKTNLKLKLKVEKLSLKDIDGNFLINL
jgi:hypothetical protein